MLTKNQEVKNIIKISSPGGFAVREDKTNNISITRVRDEIVLDIETKDIKPLYFDQVSAKFFMTSPEFHAGIFPLPCKFGDRKIDVLCGQDECALYVVGESQPISVLPPTISDPPPECPFPPCTPCPQQCEDGSCPPCDPPPLPCPCVPGSFFPNCPPNPCGAACPCPAGGCPPCDVDCECPDCASPCPNGGCPPCTTDPPGCDPAGTECCMCDQGGMCMTVQINQYGYTTQGPTCPRGANPGENEGDEDVPVYDDGPTETVCPGSDCNCPCPSNENICNRAAGAAISSLVQCKSTTRTFCNSSSNTSTYTHPVGGSVILSSDTGLLDMSGLDMGPTSLPENDTIIEGEPGYNDVPCGSADGGAPCFCRCCVSEPCGSLPLCGGCPSDAPEPPQQTSMCQNSGTSILYRKMCVSPGMDFCTIVASGGDCTMNEGQCAAVPVVIVSWYPNINVTNVEDTNGIVTGFDIGLSGNPIGGPGALGAAGCNSGHGSSTATQSGNFDDIFPDTAGQAANPIWPSNNIDPDPFNCE